MELDEDDNHHHHLDHDNDHDRNHRHERDRNDRNDQLDLGRVRKRRRVISSEGSANRQNNKDWAEGLHREVERQQLRQFRIRHDRREQVLPQVLTVSGAPVYMPGLRAVQEEAFRVANHISPNLDEESINREIQIQLQDVTVNNIQNEQRQQTDVIDLEQNIQQQIEDIPRNEQGNINNEAEQPTQTGAIHTPQTETPYNLQHKQTGQNDDLNNMAEQIPLQSVESITGLLNLTHQASLSETGSLNEQQQQQLSISLSPSSSSLIQIKQSQQPDQKQYLFVTDPNHQIIKGVQQSKNIPIEYAVNHLPLLSEDPKSQVEIKIYTGEQLQHINKMEQADQFQNMMENMMSKLQGHSNEDEAMRLLMQILNKLSPEEQYRVKRNFGQQMRLTSFYEAQIQRRITEYNNNAVHIDTGWDFGSGTVEQQKEFQEDFKNEFQLLEI
ncbi:MAG: hypothetical protein EZS28_017045 [Streblomastix strix]|uniref:Uncharacterized protein n=1 Tax=Streblomastix strix TaxID=222440 RepID=A0A5J4VYU1_9EUKA|nr:MAG: hypothetical protein EZS28_017045 [Streblomastix strix]